MQSVPVSDIYWADADFIKDFKPADLKRKELT